MKKLCLLLLLCLFWHTPVIADDVLSKEDVQLYRTIFAAQRKEDWKQADQAIKQLTDKSLMGHVLATRYLSKTYKTRTKEIESWLKNYSDLPQASSIYGLGKIKKANLPAKRPTAVYSPNAGTCSVVSRAEPIDMLDGLDFFYLKTKDQRQTARKLMKNIVKHLRAGRTLNARQLIDGKEAKILFSRRDHDAARIALGFSYFLDGRDDKVMEVAEKAVKRSGDMLPLGYWTLGLSLWRQGKTAKSVYYFEQVANNDNANSLLQSAGAFWASRAHLKLGNFAKSIQLLEIAANHPRTFYGLLATRVLGRDLNYTWGKPVLPSDEITESFSHPALERVSALKQIGEENLAQQELAALFLRADKETKMLLVMIAQQQGFDEDLTEISGILDDETSGRYPAPNWSPENGWRLDKALVFAFIKQESCFNTYAKSKVGAIGLMQLMPGTARKVAKSLGLAWEYSRMNEPEYNLTLGQQYILELMEDSNVQNNLLYVAVAYNSGPGGLIKIKNKMPNNTDPLLFIESIPFKETRGFVERIMANYWIYQTLMDQDVYSMDHLIAGQWPVYQS